MKREEILLYLSTNTIRLYLVNLGKENIIEKDTSLFFEFGEILDEKKCEKELTNIFAKLSFNLLKPNITILYNDISHSDIKFLYRCSIREVNFNYIYFVSITNLVKKYVKKDNIVIFDKNYYTLIDQHEKTIHEEYINFEPIYIGKKDSKYSHYSDKDIIWNTFKTYFTKLRTCDKMDVGDDEY